MQRQKNHRFLLKILIVGIFMAALVSIFHPGAEQFSVIINGEPVADPLIRLAAVPTILAVLLFTGLLMFLVFFGVGIFVFMVVLGLLLLCVFLVAPDFWPMLVILSLVILMKSFGGKEKS